MEGALVGSRYRVGRVLGRGGMGSVYQAVNVATGRSVALKIPHPELAADPRFRLRFLREVRAASHLRHPNVIDVLDVIEDENGLLVAVMELLEGAPLSRVLASRGRLTLAETASVLVPVLRALHEAHAAGIVHRDIKPDNVFVAAGRDDTMVPKLLDFGVARVLGPLGEGIDASATQTGALVGSPQYMAPEQVAGRRDVDRRADVWAAGALAFECLAGTRLLAGENFGQIFAAILQGELPRLGERVAGLPEGVTRAVGSCLVRDRDARAATLSLLIDALAPYARSDALASLRHVPDPDLVPTVDSGSPPRTREAATPEATPGTPPATRESAATHARESPTDAAPRRSTWIRTASAAAVASVALVVTIAYFSASEAPSPDAREVAPIAPPASDAAAAHVTSAALIDTVQSAGWRLGERLARDGLERDPTSRDLRYHLAAYLLEKSRLGSEGRMAALREARGRFEQLVAETPSDHDARYGLVLAHYVSVDRVAALTELERLPEQTVRESDIRARVAWYAGFQDAARQAIARCLETEPPPGMCAALHQFELEIEHGRAGIERARADERVETASPVIARVRARVLLGLVDEAALLVETGMARGELDPLDRAYVLGLVASARGDLDGARSRLAELSALVADPDVLQSVRMNGAMQLAEVAASIGDVETLERAAGTAVECGLYNARYWEHSTVFAPHRARLAGAIAASRARSAAEWERARGFFPD